MSGRSKVLDRNMPLLHYMGVEFVKYFYMTEPRNERLSFLVVDLYSSDQ